VRALKTFLIAVILAGFGGPALFASGMFGSPSRSEYINGNSAFDAGNYETALTEYEKASVNDPESAYIYFNRGTVFFKTEEYEKAKESFEQAALKSEDLQLESLSYFNLGNTALKSAERKIQDNLEEAVAGFEDSINMYRRSLELDPQFDDAAHNLEVARIILKDLLDKLKQQQDAMQEEQKKLQEIVERLQILIEEEASEIESNKELTSDKTSRGLSDELLEKIDTLRSRQQDTLEGTVTVSEELQELAAQNQGQSQAGGPVEQALAHLDSALVEQGVAVELLASRYLEQTLPSQEEAHSELVNALVALTEPQQDQSGENQESPEEGDQQNETDQSEDEQQTAEVSLDERAEDIIEEEKDREKQITVPGGYFDVDRDW
jgi:tetratricopeptide (TPR) repeat protein